VLAATDDRWASPYTNGEITVALLSHTPMTDFPFSALSPTPTEARSKGRPSASASFAQYRRTNLEPLSPFRIARCRSWCKIRTLKSLLEPAGLVEILQRAVQVAFGAARIPPVFEG
jgi:hypothetical protein